MPSGHYDGSVSMTVGDGGRIAAELDQVRLESDTLYGLIRLVASSPDLNRVLDGLVGVLTKATRCHACFVYLRRGERLRLRAASSLYAQLVGQVQFGVDEGLAGWVVRKNKPAFIRENAIDDPRTNLVPELEEERFQSMVAVPIPSRGGTPMGVIVLHTIAPREFDEGTLNLLSHAAPLLAGAIENAQLYEEARRRVASLTALSTLSQQIAGVAGREPLYHAVTHGLRALLGAKSVRLYELDEKHLEIVAGDPQPDAGLARQSANASRVLLELLQRRGRRDRAASLRVHAALGLDPAAGQVVAAPVAAGDEHLGVLVAIGVAGRATLEESEDLLRAVANQLAVALRQVELIERLTEQNLVRDLFSALTLGRLDDAEARARQARCDLDRAHVLVHVMRPHASSEGTSWPQLAERTELALRRLAPGALCDVGDEHLRALLPLTAGGDERELRILDEALVALSAHDGTAIGRGDAHHGVTGAATGLRDAADAAAIAGGLQPDGGALAYSELGAYRYLVQVLAADPRSDPYLDAIRVVAEYDERRGSQLVATLEQYLADRRSVTTTARALKVHPNTLRQRLERVEALSNLNLATADLLALELAVKLARLKRPSA